MVIRCHHKNSRMSGFHASVGYAHFGRPFDESQGYHSQGGIDDSSHHQRKRKARKARFLSNQMAFDAWSNGYYNGGFAVPPAAPVHAEIPHPQPEVRTPFAACRELEQRPLQDPMYPANVFMGFPKLETTDLSKPPALFDIVRRSV